MKRRLGLLLAAATLATVGMFAPTPASADIDVCAGQGNAVLTTGKLGYPVNAAHPGVTHPHNSNFFFNFGLVGACAVKTEGLAAIGTVTGWCGLSYGAGTTNNVPGHNFTFTSTGTVLVLTGEVTGVVSALPDPTHQGSCTNETADHFVITGAALKTHGGPSVTPPLQTVCGATAVVC